MNGTIRDLAQSLKRDIHDEEVIYLFHEQSIIGRGFHRVKHAAFSSYTLNRHRQ